MELILLSTSFSMFSIDVLLESEILKPLNLPKMQLHLDSAHSDTSGTTTARSKLFLGLHPDTTFDHAPLIPDQTESRILPCLWNFCWALNLILRKCSRAKCEPEPKGLCPTISKAQRRHLFPTETPTS